MKKRRFLALTLALTLALPHTGVLAAGGEEPDYIVKLTDNAPMLLSGEDDRALGFGMYLVTETEARALLEAGLAEFMEEDGVVELLEADPRLAEQWHLGTGFGVDAQAAWALGYTGRGVKIGIVDSGVIPNHEDLNYQSEENPEGNILTGWSVADSTADTTDVVGHGSMVTGIIAAARDNGKGGAGVAPDVQVLPIKCFTGNTTTISDLVAGINKAVSAGCDIINLSSGATGDTSRKALKTATQAAVDEGIIVVAAVGNKGTAQLYYPAAYDHVVGVGNLTADGTVANNSERNESVWVAAPGFGILSLGYNDSTSYRTGSGTSYATPVVSALAALAVQKARAEGLPMSPADFQNLLRLTAADQGEAGYDYDYGWGTVNAVEMLNGMEKRTVSLDPGDGALEDGNSLDYVPYSGEAVTLPVPAREGYLFVGWYGDDQFQGERTDSFIPAQDSPAGCYYAKWVNDETALASVTLAGYEAERTQGDSYVVYIPAGTDLTVQEVSARTEYSTSACAVTRTETGWDLTVTQASGHSKTYPLTADTSYSAPKLTQEAPAAEIETVPASLDGKTPVKEYSQDVSVWFTDENTAPETLTYSLEGEAVGLTLTGTTLKYTPAAADAGKMVETRIVASNRHFSTALSLTIRVGALPYSPPVLTAGAGTFRTQEPTDLTVGFEAYGGELTAVKAGDKTLAEGVDYDLVKDREVEAQEEPGDIMNAVILKKEYLDTLPGGENLLLLHFDTGREEPATAQAEYTVTVERPVAGVTVTPASMTAGGTVTLAAAVTPENATNRTAVFTLVDPGETGAVLEGNTLSASAQGTAALSVTIPDGLCGSDFTQEFTVTVKTKPVVPVGPIGPSGPSISEPEPEPSPEPELTVDETGRAGLELAQGETTLTEAQAQAVIEANAETEVAVTAGEVTVILPAGTLAQGDDLSGLLPDPTAATGERGQVVAFTNAQGEREIVALSQVGEGSARFVAKGPGSYEILDNAAAFDDLAGHWAEGSAAFVSARELFQGTGEGRFQPELETSRAMIFTVLYRLEGGRALPGEGESWYAPALAWAVEQEVSDGSAPEAPVSREQLVTLLWRCAGQPEGEPLTGFTDTDEISGWAEEAMAWAAGEGILTGKPGGRLDPKTGATRAEVAVLMERFVTYLVERY